MHYIYRLLTTVYTVTTPNGGSYQPPPTWFDTFTNYMAYSSIIPIILFIYYYGTKKAPGKWYKRRYSALWRSTSIGRTLMYQMIAWLSYLVFIAVGLAFRGDYVFKPAIRFIIYGYLVFLFWRLFTTLRAVQKSRLKIDSGTIGVPLDSDLERTKPKTDPINK